MKEVLLDDFGDPEGKEASSNRRLSQEKLSEMYYKQFCARPRRYSIVTRPSSSLEKTCRQEFLIFSLSGLQPVRREVC